MRSLIYQHGVWWWPVFRIRMLPYCLSSLAFLKSCFTAISPAMPYMCPHDPNLIGSLPVLPVVPWVLADTALIAYRARIHPRPFTLFHNSTCISIRPCTRRAVSRLQWHHCCSLCCHFTGRSARVISSRAIAVTLAPTSYGRSFLHAHIHVDAGP